jgi:hypothetical protein
MFFLSRSSGFPASESGRFAILKVNDVDALHDGVGEVKRRGRDRLPFGVNDDFVSVCDALSYMARRTDIGPKTQVHSPGALTLFPQEIEAS